MNQSFLKNKKAKTALFASFTLLLLLSVSNFNKDDRNDLFDEICKNADAYFLHSYTDVSYSENWSSYTRDISVDYKMVINTSKGVEDYAFLNLSEYVSNNIERFKVTTLKANGDIIDLDSSLVFRKAKKTDDFGEINYPIPAVEPGDTIQTTYVYSERVRYNDLIDYVNLVEPIPSYNSQYSIKTNPELTVRYKTYNQFPEPSVVANDTIIYLQFSKDHVKGIEQNEFNCLLCDQPYLYYAVERKDSELRTWKDVYNEEFNVLTQPVAIDYENSSYFSRWMRRTIGKAKDSSKYHKFRVLHEEVLNTFGIEESIKRKEVIKGSGYFLKQERFNPLSLRRFYRQVLEDLDINYWAVFARTKNLGEIDKYYIRRGEFDHMFFAFENELGNIEFIYPHEEYYRYQLNELPPKLYGTDAILVKPIANKKKSKKEKFISRNLKMAKVDSVDILEVKIPSLNETHNYLNQVVSSDIDMENKSASFRFRFKVSGGMSTELRSFFSMLDQDEEASQYYDALDEFEGDESIYKIDSVTGQSLYGRKPFVFRVNAHGQLDDAITFLNDSIVSIPVDKFVNHTQVETDIIKNELNYYLDYRYSDQFMLYLNFPSDIELLGTESGETNYKNEFGEYYFELKKTANNQLRLKSNYNIIKDKIPADKLDNLDLLNEQVKTIKNKRVVVKLRSN
ncbi:MAG: DUF3857 domain-containing protein [bacterium]